MCWSSLWTFAGAFFSDVVPMPPIVEAFSELSVGVAWMFETIDQGVLDVDPLILFMCLMFMFHVFTARFLSQSFSVFFNMNPFICLSLAFRFLL